jgi:hypothetical protein
MAHGRITLITKTPATNQLILIIKIDMASVRRMSTTSVSYVNRFSTRPLLRRNGKKETSGMAIE